jgi:hypothetical protein
MPALYHKCGRAMQEEKSEADPIAPPRETRKIKINSGTIVLLSWSPN